MNTSELKIAIIHEYMLKIGGAEKVLLALHEAYPSADIFTFLYDEEGTKGLFKDCKIQTSSLQKNRLFNKRPRLLLSKYPKVIEEFDLSEYDLVISNSNSFAHGVITKPKTLHICYCHSPIRYAWDWYHQYLAENNITRGLKSFYVRNVLHNIRIWDRVSADRVDAWLSNSNNVKERVRKYYRKDSEILYPPVDISNIEISDNVPDSYYVIVSRLEPYKKIEIAISAFNQNKKQLIIIGVGSMETKLKKMSNKNIEFLGWQSNKSVYEYLRNAKALIFPGEEDFGITPVESMACGRPVIAYANGGVLETVVSDKTGIFFEEENGQSLNSAIDKLEENYTNFSSIACRKQAERFSKEIFLSNIDQLVNKYYEQHKKALKQ